MNKLVITLAVIMGTLMVIPVITHADEYYVIRDQAGQMAVTDGAPGYGWFVQSGPYATIDAAERATGTGTGNFWLHMQQRPLNFPQVVPRYSGQAPMAQLTP